MSAALRRRLLARQASLALQALIATRARLPADCAPSNRRNGAAPSLLSGQSIQRLSDLESLHADRRRMVAAVQRQRLRKIRSGSFHVAIGNARLAALRERIVELVVEADRGRETPTRRVLLTLHHVGDALVVLG